MNGKPCTWCHNPIPEHFRADAVTCTDRCRQARARARAAGFYGDLAGWRRLPRIGRQRYVQVPIDVGRRVTATEPTADGPTP